MSTSELRAQPAHVVDDPRYFRLPWAPVSLGEAAERRFVWAMIARS
jgi:hypothetical protein